MNIIRFKRKDAEGKWRWLHLKMGIQIAWGCRQSASIFEPNTLQFNRAIEILDKAGELEGTMMISGVLR